MRDNTYTPLAYGPTQPRGLLTLFHDPPAFMLPVPDVAIKTTWRVVTRVATHAPMDRVSVWLDTSTMLGTVTPVVEVELLAGVVGGNSERVAGTAKALTSLIAQPFVFQVAGLSATIFTLRARIQSGGSQFSAQFRLIGDRSHCCELHTIV